MRREESERRERYVAGVTALCNRERDIALAAYDGEAAAEAIPASNSTRACPRSHVCRYLMRQIEQRRISNSNRNVGATVPLDGSGPAVPGGGSSANSTAIPTAANTAGRVAESRVPRRTHPETFQARSPSHNWHLLLAEDFEKFDDPP
jgi:hypothetical protein